MYILFIIFTVFILLFIFFFKFIGRRTIAFINGTQINVNDNNIKEVNCSRIIENNKYRSKEKIQKEHQEKYEGKPLHGQFRKATEEVRSKRSWDWLKKDYLKKETESIIVAA